MTIHANNPAGIVQAFLAKGSLPLSRSVSQVQSMLSQADYNAADLAEHLRLDPTLAARVMAVANSAFFSRQPCAAIEDAVNRLGTVQLSRIFAQVLASAALIRPLQSYGLPADAIWRRSVTAAVGTEMAAGRIGENRSSAYMVGLLHLVGLLVIDGLWSKQPTPSKLERADFDKEWSAGEKHLCGYDQAEIGAEMLRQLSFPASIVDTVGRQYRKPAGPLESSLYVGRLVRTITCDKIIPEPNADVMRDFKFTTNSQFDSFVADVHQEVQNLLQAA